MAKHSIRPSVKNKKRKKLFKYEGSYLEFLLNKDKREIHVEMGQPKN